MFIDAYLSEGHVNAYEFGCLLAALASEIPRQANEVREAANHRIQSMITFVQQTLPTTIGKEQAMVVISTIIGAIQLARAVSDVKEAKNIGRNEICIVKTIRC